MATSTVADKLLEWAEKLEESLAREQSQGDNYIALRAEEVEQLVDDLSKGSFVINGFINGSI